MPPSSPGLAALLAHAVRHLRAGRPGEAVGSLQQAAALQPSNPTIQHDLGLACLDVGRLQEAATAFQAAIAANPRYTDAFLRLGIALERSGQTRAAIVAYDRATELRPSLTEAWYRAGALVFLLGHREAAIGCFRRAAASGPKTSFGRLGKARAFLAEADAVRAERVLRQTLVLDAANAVAHDLLGNLLADSGRFAEARECFARAIAHAPLMAGSYYDLVRCRRVTQDDADLRGCMQSALATPGLEAEHRIRVYLALGKASDDLGEPDIAMRHFEAAESIRRDLVTFDQAGFDREIDRLIAHFTPELIARAEPLGQSSATPVLILGMPRSGTTLTEQIVSSHPEVAAGGELNFWNERGAAWIEAGMLTERPVLDRLAHDYLGLLRGIGPGATRVTDKMPFNFIWAGLIHLALPGATIIHCRRAAIDTALSIHQTHFNPRLSFPTGRAELVEYFRSYRRLADHWRAVLPPARFIEIDYEDLTSAPERVIRRMIAAAGLAWDQTCLHPERNGRAVSTPSRWQARQPIYRDSVQRWRRYADRLGPLAALLIEPDPPA